VSVKRDVDVVIAGAGPVGLALAVDLGQQGISVAVLDGETEPPPEMRDRKANALNNRSMEYMRRLGASSAIHARVEPSHRNLDVAFVTSLVGHEIARFKNAFENSPEPPPDGMSPEQYLRVNQIDIVEILRDMVGALPNVHLSAGARFQDYSEVHGGIDIAVSSIEGQSMPGVTARYLIGCDGGASDVRKKAGIKLLGEGRLASNLNVVFFSPEAYAANIHPDASMFWVVDPRFNGYIAPGEKSGRMTIWDVDDDKEADIRADPLKYIAAAVGRRVEAQIHSYQRWHTHHLQAAEYRKGRIFIAGDAAHMHPPTSGLGMNTGLGDASNLGWKLGAVIKGWGNDGLLESYEAERLPIGAQVVALSNHQYSLAPCHYWNSELDDRGAESEAMRAAMRARILKEKATEFFSRGMVLGQTYRGSPTIVEDGSAVVNTDEIQYIPTSQPGARLPHVFRDGVSLYDEIERHGLTLLSVGGQTPGIDQMAATAKAGGVPLGIVELGRALRPIYETAFVLVRPDHHVAWRGDRPFSSKDLATVCGSASGGP
jgi:2-polyprenyl-6-methoxyphenol hydroxylase-like FAD-dependent oxidoreductase